MNAVPHVLGDLRNPQETDDAESDDGQAREEARPRRAARHESRREHAVDEPARNPAPPDAGRRRLDRLPVSRLSCRVDG
jgi:cobalamin-dependent methionine synthase I